MIPNSPPERSASGALEVVRCFARAQYPHAQAVFLAGSWARDSAHSESDLDIIILDPLAERVSFEGVLFNGWVIEICVIPLDGWNDFLRSHAEGNSAIIPHQLASSRLVLGDACVGGEIQDLARRVILHGPLPQGESERFELRWELTVLLADLGHAPDEALPALAALCYRQLGKAYLALMNAWQADRKAFRSALFYANPTMANNLERALVAACNGDRAPLVGIGREILEGLGGQQRTYPKFEA